MKKALALMLVATLCVVSVFALDFNFGYAPKSDSVLDEGSCPLTKAFISQDVSVFEIGLGVQSGAPHAFVNTFIDEACDVVPAIDSLKEIPAAVSEIFSSAVESAGANDAYNLQGYLFVNLLKEGVFKLGVGACADYSLKNTDAVDLSALAKATFQLSRVSKIFVMGGATVGTVDFSDDVKFDVTFEEADFLKSLTIGYAFSL